MPIGHAFRTHKLQTKGV